ncbi:hypothetical protein X777_12411 [Ooceraea biroi]|uniref:Uncharacterized protein n=1 Tax=Ooceraea biroi TaxID=2015173 RepID=A0A026VZ62_OOCBI|nr:hypothetical protein X777_12411 [Ooceraea biroi]
MILVHTIVDHDDHLRLQSPAFSIQPRYRAKVIESDIHERSNEPTSLAVHGVFRASGKVGNKKSNEFLGRLSPSLVHDLRNTLGARRLDRSIDTLANRINEGNLAPSKISRNEFQVTFSTLHTSILPRGTDKNPLLGTFFVS